MGEREVGPVRFTTIHPDTTQMTHNIIIFSPFHLPSSFTLTMLGNGFLAIFQLIPFWYTIRNAVGTGPLRVNSDRSLFEDDIKQTSWISRSRIFRNAMKDRQFTWPNGLVPYLIDPTLDPIAVASFEEAIKELESNTCLRFRPKIPTDIHHIILTSMGGCWSFVGRQEDRPDGQELSLSPLCWEKSTIQHEIMHALGFFHEHSRFDRDKYIFINLTNVEKKHWNQFDKRDTEETDLLTDYDYDSILHYHAYAWAKDKTIPTITPKKTGAIIGQRHGYSNKDYEKINRLYICYDNLKLTKENSSISTIPITPSIPHLPKTVFPAVSTKLPHCSNAHLCQDKDTLNCPTLAAQGWCEMMPGKMLFDCRKSCCNCDYSKCEDTTVHFYWQNYCFSNQYWDGVKTWHIHFPATCQSPFTFQTAGDFCPKMCGRC